MIGRLVLSERNIYKLNMDKKQVSARKCYILSESIIKPNSTVHNDMVLIKTNCPLELRNYSLQLHRA